MPRKLSFGTEDKRRSMTKMTREERKLFDAQADHEAWSLAHEILEPWVRTTKPIGSDELTQVMEKALAHVEMEPNRTRCAGVPPSGHGATQVRRVRPGALSRACRS
jgi:hypothetical protein